MKQVSLFDQYLNKEQLNRCYEVYDFMYDEEIVSTWYDKDTNQLYIEYIDEEGLKGVYEPRCSEEEDYYKLVYILTGEEVD